MAADWGAIAQAIQADVEVNKNLTATYWSNEESKKATDAARDYNTRMASTSYQRAVEDLKNAGLNPALAYQQGGAPSPTTQPNQVFDYGASLARGAGAGIAKAKLFGELKNLQTTNEKQQAEKVLTDTLVGKAQADTQASTATAENVRSVTKLNNARLPAARLEGEIAESPYGKTLGYINAGVDTVRNIFQAINGIRDVQRPYYGGRGNSSPVKK